MTDHALRIVFAGTPEFAAGHLSSLLENDFNVVAVYSQPDRPAGRGKKILPTPVKQVALAHDIAVFQPEKLDSGASETLQAVTPDVLVVVAYGLILKSTTLAIPRLGCINVHASLLPRWRGAAPIERAILAGDTETGVSLMQMDTGLDTGDVLLQLKTPITASDNAGTLAERLLELGCQGLSQVLTDLQEWQSKAEKQNSALATYAKKLSKSDAEINWSKTALEIQHQVQALFPRSPAYCHFQDERLRVIAARRVESDDRASPGTVLEVGENSMRIACGQDALEITMLQLPGKKAATLKDIHNGHPGLFEPGLTFIT